MGKFGGIGSSTVLTDLQVDGTTVTVDASNNRLGLGTAAPGTQVQIEGATPYITLKNDTAENTDGGCESRIIFEDHANVTLAQIQGSHDGSSDDTKGDLIFSTHDGSSLDEALRIDSAQLATFTAAATVTTNLTVGGDIILDDGGSLKEAGGTAAITFDGSGHVTKIGQDSASSGEFLKYDGSKWVSDSVSSGGGADVGVANTFTEAQKISKDQDSELIALILKNESDANNTSGIVSARFDLEDTGGNEVDSGKIAVKKEAAFTATASTQDSSMFFSTSLNGTLTEQLKLNSAGSLSLLVDGNGLVFGADGEVTLTHVHDTGLLLTDDSGVGTTKLMFGDAACFIQQQADGQLGIDADSVINVTAPTVDIDASTLVTITGPGLTVDSSGAGEPALTLKTTHTTKTSSAELQFLKDAADTEDGEVLGQITFYGEDEGNNNTLFAKIVAEISESDETDEAGKLSFFVAESDGTTTAATAGLVLEGEHATDGEIDVTIAAGSSSTTTVAGVLKVVGNVIQASDGGTTITMDTSDNVTVAGDVTVGGGDLIGPTDGDLLIKSDGNITFRIDADNDETGQTFAFQNNASTEIASLNESGTLQLDGDLTVDGGDIAYGNGQNATLNVAATAHNAAGKNLTVTAGTTTAGTTNDIAGGSLTIQGGQGKGTGAGGDIIFQTANAAGGSASSLNGLATAFTISDDLSSTFAGAIQANSTISVGSNGTGHDVKFYGDTSGKMMMWDQDRDELILTTTTKLNFNDDSSSGNEHIFASADGHLEVNAGTTLDCTAPTIDLNASTAVIIDGPAVTVADSADGKPVLTLKTTHTTKTSSGELQFLKDAADTEDGEVLGQITFYGEDEGNNNTAFAKIVASISESDEGDEAGKLEFFVAESDSTTTALSAGLTLEGEHATDGEIDVTIGAGTGSTTTIAGTLDLGDRNITNVGDISLDSVSSDGSLVTINAPCEVANGSSGGATALVLDNDDTDQIAFAIEAANIDADVIDITADAVTTANVIDITADALTSGAALKIVSDCSSTTVRSLAHIHQDHASATHAACLRLTQDGAGPALQVEGPVVTDANTTQDNDANGHTITATELIDGTFFAINRGTGKTDTTATAAQIVAAVPNVSTSTMFVFRYINLSSNTVTLAGGTSVTMVNGAGATFSIPSNQGRYFAFNIGNITGDSEAVTMVPLSSAYSCVT
tara:strand:- start:2478 stop:6059 length:3582 start_codon:yes stop_codon:yes gene_type:complete